MFTAMQTVGPSHLMDPKRYDFKSIKITGQADLNGDKVFDEEDFPAPSLPGIGLVHLEI